MGSDTSVTVYLILSDYVSYALTMWLQGPVPYTEIP